MASDKFKIIISTLLLTAFLLYSFFIYSSLPVKSSHVSNEVIAGKEVWQKYNCNACHQVYGLGGYLGPDLTNVYSKKGPAYINAFIYNGTASMPKFRFTDVEISSLLAYMQNMDASGNADPRRFKINNDGTIEQQ